MAVWEALTQNIRQMNHEYYNEPVVLVFSSDEMQALYKKSLDFVGVVMHSFRFLYRCKPKIYYDDIQVRQQTSYKAAFHMCENPP